MQEARMGELRLTPATRPTMYFIGVSTTKSMIMRVFPSWARALGFGDCELKGIDLALHDSSERYRKVVSFIRNDPLSLGALVTTHKIDLLHACKDMFDELDDFASLMGEVSAIAKKDGRLVGAAKDAISSGYAVEAFLPKGHWERTRADAFILGAGGSSIALSSFLANPERGASTPSRIFVSNRSPGRLEEIKAIHARQSLTVPIEYVLTPSPADNDAIMARLPEGSLVVNATGLGKDAPGSPITDAAFFPRNGLVWDFNYRGELDFLHQAKVHEAAQSLHIEDGWLYFIFGWLAVVAEVFHRDIPLEGPQFNELRAIADRERK
jgi:shikimate 5-dehydrogenase